MLVHASLVLENPVLPAPVVERQSPLGSVLPAAESAYSQLERGAARPGCSMIRRGGIMASHPRPPPTVSEDPETERSF